MANIKSIKNIGVCDAYDLEINHTNHQFYLSNGVLTSNSHAIFYSMLGFHTAYLKAHYPLEFLTANLMSEVNSNAKISKDNINKIKEEIRKLKINVLPPDINKSDVSYKIIDNNTLITGLDALKFIGKDAIPEIIKTRPFNNFEDFLTMVDGKKVRAPAIQALAASGCLDFFGLPRKLMFLYASDFKKKLQVHLRKSKNKETKFQYPWPNESEWNVPELYALEQFYLGEGNRKYKSEAYDGFFTSRKEDIVDYSDLAIKFPLTANDENYKIYYVKGEIKSIFEFTVKKKNSKHFGKKMARITLEDINGNNISMVCFSDEGDPNAKGWNYLRKRAKTLGCCKIEPGEAICVHGSINWYGGDISIIFRELESCCKSPALPKDLKAKKVSIKSNKTVKSCKKIDIDSLDAQTILDEIEDELVEEGHVDLDDDNYETI